MDLAASQRSSRENLWEKAGDLVEARRLEAPYVLEKLVLD